MSSTHSLRPHDLVVLQRSAGNQAVSRLLQIDATAEAPMASSDGSVAKPSVPPDRVDRLLDRLCIVARWPLRASID